ncbi:hypothetical protein D3C72_1251080 [compost metagenome]
MTKPIALVLAVALLGAAPAVTAGCAPAKAKDTAAQSQQKPQDPKAPPAAGQPAKAPINAAAKPPAPANGRKPVAESRTPAGKVKVDFVGKPRLLPKKKTTHK